jgi:hypothetical protein
MAKDLALTDSEQMGEPVARSRGICAINSILRSEMLTWPFHPSLFKLLSEAFTVRGRPKAPSTKPLFR